MGKIKNNYFSIAYNDLHYLLRYDADDEYSYNRVAVETQQVVEKLLKGLVEISEDVPVDEKAKLLGTHNLRRLGESVNLHYSKKLSITDLAYLKDFYFEARYPGDNFVEVTKETRDKCMEILSNSLAEIKSICPDFPNELQKMNLF